MSTSSPALAPQDPSLKGSDGRVLPWQQQQWSQVMQSLSHDSLGHALLLTGAQGIGKSVFAARLAHYLLCRQSSDQPCGQCSSCQLYSNGYHPDLHLIHPAWNEKTAKEKKSISIDQIRTLIAALTLKSKCGGPKIAIISPAQLMTTEAANSLLKTLEEPQGPCYILLLTPQPDSLLATIRSRCHKIHFSIPATALSVPWLQEQLGTDNAERTQSLLAIATGAPLAALALADNKDFVAARATTFKLFIDLLEGTDSDGAMIAQLTKSTEVDAVTLHQWLISWLSDLVHINHSTKIEGLINQDFSRQLVKVAARREVTILFYLIDILKKSMREINPSLNHQLLLETLFINLYNRIRSSRLLA